MRRHPLFIAYLALASVCVFWGTTYLGIRMALETFSPLMLVGLRYTFSGSLLLLVAYFSKAHLPTGKELFYTALFGVIIIGIGTAVWSTSPYNVNFTLPGITIGEYTFTGNHIAAACAAVVIALALELFLSRTRPGKAIRAVADNREAAELMGISSTMVLALAFAIGIALAAASGSLVSTLFPFTILSGAGYQMKSFVVTVLAGLGKPLGALIAGILLGLLEGAVTPFIAVSWIPMIEFGLFVVVLVAFPRGIFGRATA